MEAGTRRIPGFFARGKAVSKSHLPTLWERLEALNVVHGGRYPSNSRIFRPGKSCFKMSLGRALGETRSTKCRPRRPVPVEFPDFSPGEKLFQNLTWPQLEALNVSHVGLGGRYHVQFPRFFARGNFLCQILHKRCSSAAKKLRN